MNQMDLSERAKDEPQGKQKQAHTASWEGGVIVSVVLETQK